MSIDNALNKKVKPTKQKYELNGEYKTLREWTEIYNADYKKVASRSYRCKWPLLKALTESA